MENAQGYHQTSYRLWALWLCLSVSTQALAQDSLTFWYGADQYLGDNGRPQRWVNVLGNVKGAEQLETLTWVLNETYSGELNWGGDLHRLALAGDFNIEIGWDQLQLGENALELTTTYRNGQTIRAATRLHLQAPRSWPLPYSVDFSRIDNLQKAVQVVDGQWELNDQGVHTVQRYYDRVLTLGDTSWQDYEALIRLTLHGFTPPEPGPPTYNVTHFGVAFWWRGHHHQPDIQPNRKWYPLGAQGEFLLKSPPDSSHWRILFDGKSPGPVYGTRRKRYRLGAQMYIRAQVSRTAEGGARYRFKQWLTDASEPIGWDVEGIEAPENTDYIGGALCLVPHHSDVTIHQVAVEPLAPYPYPLATRPGPGALHRSAPAGGMMGAKGQAFTLDLLPAGHRLTQIEVKLGEAPLKLVKGLRFTVQHPGGQVRQTQIGAGQGNWQPPFSVPAGAALVGISGRSGWGLDALQFHFDDGSQSPTYGGEGGDTYFALRLHQRPALAPAAIRGFFGTYTAAGIETLGLLFDPHGEKP